MGSDFLIAHLLRRVSGLANPCSGERSPGPVSVSGLLQPTYQELALSSKGLGYQRLGVAERFSALFTLAEIGVLLLYG